MRKQVTELAQTLWAARRGDELMDTVTQIETLKSTLDALELDVTRELEATHAVKPMGWASTQDFITAVAGGHKACGPAMVRLAKAVETPVFAPVGEAMADGWLSTAKAQVIVRAVEHLPGNTDLRHRGVQVLLDEAKRLDATGLAKAGRYLIERVDPDGQARKDEAALEREERAAHLGRELWFKFDGAGGFRFGGRGSAEDGAKLKATLMALAKPVPEQRTGLRPRHLRDPRVQPRRPRSPRPRRPHLRRPHRALRPSRPGRPTPGVPRHHPAGCR